MARLTDAERAEFKRLAESGWTEAPAQRSPMIVAPTAEARERYCRWATEAARFYRGSKPVRFVGEKWRL